MANTELPPRAANDNDSGYKVLSFGQAQVLRNMPRYLKAGGL